MQWKKEYLQHLTSVIQPIQSHYMISALLENTEYFYQVALTNKSTYETFWIHQNTTVLKHMMPLYNFYRWCTSKILFGKTQNANKILWNSHGNRDFYLKLKKKQFWMWQISSLTIVIRSQHSFATTILSLN